MYVWHGMAWHGTARLCMGTWQGKAFASHRIAWRRRCGNIILKQSHQPTPILSFCKSVSQSVVSLVIRRASKMMEVGQIGNVCGCGRYVAYLWFGLLPCLELGTPDTTSDGRCRGTTWVHLGHTVKR